MRSRSYILLGGGLYYDCSFTRTIHYYCYPHIIHQVTEIVILVLFIYLW